MKAGKIILIILLLLVLVGGGVFAYLWFMTDIFKSPKSLYDNYSESLKAELNKFANKEAMDKFINQVKKEEYTVKSSLDFSFTNDSDTVSFDDIIEFEGSKDASGENSQMKLTVNYSDKESFETDVVVNDKKLYGVFFEGVTNSFLGLNMDNLEEWLEKLGADEEVISSLKDTMEKAEKYDATYMLDKYEEYAEKYAEIVKKNIPDSAYAKSDDKNDKSITLTLESKDLAKIVDAVGKELVKDIEKFADEMGEEASEELELDELEESIEEAVDEIKGSKITLTYKLEKPEDGKNVLTVSIKMNGRAISAKITVEENKVTVDIMGLVDIIVTKKEQGKKVTYTANLKLSDSVTGMMGGSSASSLEDYKFEIVETYDGLGTDSVEEEARFTMQYGDYGMEFALEGTVEFGESDIEELTKSNTQFIDELSAEDTQALFEALGKRLVEVNTEKIEKSKISEKLDDLSGLFGYGLLSRNSTNSIYSDYDLDDDDDDYDLDDYDLDYDLDDDDNQTELENQMYSNFEAYMNSMGY